MSPTARAARLGLPVAIAALIAILLRPAVAAVPRLYAGPLPLHPFLVLEHGWLLYLAAPLGVLATLVVLLAPGFFLVLATGGETRLAPLVVKAFIGAFVAHFIVHVVIQLAFPGPVTPALFAGGLVGLVAITWVWLAIRLRRGAVIRCPEWSRTTKRRLWWLLAIPVVAVVTMVPVFFWQDLNPDGFEALEIGRSLQWKVLPRFLNESGLFGLGIGMLPMAYPIHWFMMLFGPIEAATRLPLVVHLPVVFAALVALIEHQSPRRLRGVEEGVVILALAIFVIVMGFSSGYHPYYTDLSSPPAFEVLTILFMLAAAYFLWADETGWFLAAALLAFLARPTGLLVVVLLGVGVFLAAPERRRSTTLRVAGALALWVVLIIGYEILFPSAIGNTDVRYTTSSALFRFRYVTVTDVARFGYAAIPGGLLPALALFAFPKQDPIGRSIAVASIGYFLAFYFPAFTSLHHFVPVMVLPIVVLWRLVLVRTDRLGAALGIGAVALGALWMSLPNRVVLDRSSRAIGHEIQYEIGRYGGTYEEHRAALAGQALLDAFFPPLGEIDDPSRERIGGGQLMYYAHRPSTPGADQANYLVLPPSSIATSGMTPVAESDLGTAYVRDRERWHRERFTPVAVDYRSPVYAIPPEILFRHVGVPAGRYSLDLFAVPGVRTVLAFIREQPLRRLLFRSSERKTP